MRRTGDGIDPLEVADGGKKFARPNIQEFLFFIRWVEEILRHLYKLTFANAANALVPPHRSSSMLKDMLTGGAGFPSLAQIHFDHCVFKQ